MLLRAGPARVVPQHAGLPHCALVEATLGHSQRRPFCRTTNASSRSLDSKIETINAHGGGFRINERFKVSIYIHRDDLYLEPEGHNMKDVIHTIQGSAAGDGRKGDLFNLRETEYQVLCNKSVRKSFQRNENLFVVGTRHSATFFIESGLIRVYHRG
ncbi:MAG: hypothetical protein M5U09_23845 [Gammaproteobacteria bacterium]|nr:hypothetical protein [Gammaproteobacteria bacterium]